MCVGVSWARSRASASALLVSSSIFFDSVNDRSVSDGCIIDERDKQESIRHVTDGTIARLVRSSVLSYDGRRSSRHPDVHRAMLHDPATYEDPDEFRPERFLRDGDIPLDSTAVAFGSNSVAFGFGRRQATAITVFPQQ